ncbi:MAG TPA: helix-turn-helix transcriptional regulator [Solirubrobacteraceae bacterium]|jgi:DNA-binding CsgD family transcriptional regulator
MPPGPDERLFDLVGDVLGLLELAELRDGLLQALARAIRSDYVSINELGENPGEIFASAWPVLPEHVIAAFVRHAHQNPLIQRYAATGDGRAYRFSDVTTLEELEATQLYREVYAPLGLRHQIAFTLPSAPGRIVGIALSRGDPDFDDADRDLLDRARPFLIQVYRNAIAYTAQRDALRAGASEEQLASALTGAGLTGREGEVLALVALGSSNRTAAERLGISERTVQKHLERTYAKLGVRTRALAAARAWELARELLGDDGPPRLAGVRLFPPSAR